MAEDVEALMAQAMCTWHHDHRGGATPCGQAKMEAAAVVGYLATHNHHVVPNNVSFDINGDDITVFVNDVLIFEGKRSQVTWEHPDRDVREVMQQIWEQGQDDGVQEYVVNGVPAHMTTHMSLAELMNPQRLRDDTFKREREAYWNDTPLSREEMLDKLARVKRDPSPMVRMAQDSRLHEILRDAIPPYLGEPITMPGHLTAESIYRAIEECQRYPGMTTLPDYYRVHVVPPSPRAWADAHVAAHPDHIVLIAGPADTQTQCFYPEDCKATMWTDTDYSRFQRTMAGFKWETDHNIYRQGVESSDNPGE